MVTERGQTNGSGSLANIEIAPADDHITFKVSAKANCHDLNESYAFYHIPNLYKIYPNPIRNIITIELNESEFREMQELQKITGYDQSHKLKIFDQYNMVIREESLASNFGSFTIDASGYKPGLYIIELHNRNFTKRFKVQKL